MEMETLLRPVAINARFNFWVTLLPIQIKDSYPGQELPPSDDRMTRLIYKRVLLHILRRYFIYLTAFFLGLCTSFSLATASVKMVLNSGAISMPMNCQLAIRG